MVGTFLEEKLEFIDPRSVPRSASTSINKTPSCKISSHRTDVRQRNDDESRVNNFSPI